MEALVLEDGEAVTNPFGLVCVEPDGVEAPPCMAVHSGLPLNTVCLSVVPATICPAPSLSQPWFYEQARFL